MSRDVPSISLLLLAPSSVHNVIMKEVALFNIPIKYSFISRLKTLTRKHKAKQQKVTLIYPK